jgi:hypothetical protein
VKGCLTRSQYITALIGIMFVIIIYPGFEKKNLLSQKLSQELASKVPCCVYLWSRILSTIAVVISQGAGHQALEGAEHCSQNSLRGGCHVHCAAARWTGELYNIGITWSNDSSTIGCSCGCTILLQSVLLPIPSPPGCKETGIPRTGNSFEVGGVVDLKIRKEK